MTKCILVIDDEDDIREVAQVSLEIMGGFQVLTAKSGVEGIQRAIEHQPDAILLDFLMPDLDGMDIFEQLQAHPQTCHIPVILLTAKDQSQIQDWVSQLGIKALISKPFKPTTLAQTLKTVLGWA